VLVRVLISREGTSQPMYGYLFLATVWVNAFRHAGLTKRDRVDGMHALRHYYASSCLAEGVRSWSWRTTWDTATRQSPCGTTHT